MVKRIIKKLVKFIPMSNSIIFESNPDFSDNTFWLYKYLVENEQIQKKYKLVWFVTKEYSPKVTELCGAKIKCINVYSHNKFEVLQRIYYNYTSKLIIDCNRYIHKTREDQVRIHLTHGMPIKDCASYFKQIGECDLLSVAGDGFISMFDQFVNRECIQSMGLPRNEVLFQKQSAPSKQKFIVWLPTYRQHKNKKENPQNIFPMGVPVIKTREQLEQLDQFLERKNIKLLLRMHPAQDTSVLKIGEMKNILLADDAFLEKHNITLYEILSDSNALITDYSSVYYDYLLADKPIGLMMEDMEIYAKENGLLFDNVREEFPGVQITNINEFEVFIDEVYEEKDSKREERIQFMNRFGMKEYPSGKRISEFIQRKLSE